MKKYSNIVVITENRRNDFNEFISECNANILRWEYSIKREKMKIRVFEKEWNSLDEVVEKLKANEDQMAEDKRKKELKDFEAKRAKELKQQKGGKK